MKKGRYVKNMGDQESHESYYRFFSLKHDENITHKGNYKGR